MRLPAYSTSSRSLDSCYAVARRRSAHADSSRCREPARRDFRPAADTRFLDVEWCCAITRLASLRPRTTGERDRLRGTAIGPSIRHARRSQAATTSTRRRAALGHRRPGVGGAVRRRAVQIDLAAGAAAAVLGIAVRFATAPDATYSSSSPRSCRSCGCWSSSWSAGLRAPVPRRSARTSSSSLLPRGRAASSPRWASWPTPSQVLLPRGFVLIAFPATALDLSVGDCCAAGSQAPAQPSVRGPCSAPSSSAGRTPPAPEVVADLAGVKHHGYEVVGACVPVPARRSPQNLDRVSRCSAGSEVPCTWSTDDDRQRGHRRPAPTSAGRRCAGCPGPWSRPAPTWSSRPGSLDGHRPPSDDAARRPACPCSRSSRRRRGGAPDAAEVVLDRAIGGRAGAAGPAGAARRRRSAVRLTSRGPAFFPQHRVGARRRAVHDVQVPLDGGRRRGAARASCSSRPTATA